MYRAETLLDDLPECFRRFKEQLQAHAPDDARWYRLIWYPDRGEPVEYPHASRTRPWIDSAGRLSWRRSFKVWPWEIPVVPHVGTYAVLLLRKGGDTVPTPELFFAGVELEPLERTK